MTHTKWTIDPAHSELKFKVKHMMIAQVTGSFNNLQATLEAGDEDLTSAKVEFSAKTDSIDTGNEQRDQHLKAADFFDAEHYPEIKFRSTKIENKGNSHYTLHGDLTIRDITRPVSLEVEHGGINKDPWGNTKNGFSLSGKINRNDFGLVWNAALETGGVLVSEDVKIEAEIQLAKA